MLRFLHREKPALSLQKIKYFFSVLLYIFPFLIFLFTEFKFGYKNIDFVYASMSFEKSTYEATTGTIKKENIFISHPNCLRPPPPYPHLVDC